MRLLVFVLLYMQSITGREVNFCMAVVDIAHIEQLSVDCPICPVPIILRTGGRPTESVITYACCFYNLVLHSLVWRGQLTALAMCHTAACEQSSQVPSLQYRTWKATVEYALCKTCKMIGTIVRHFVAFCAMGVFQCLEEFDHSAFELLRNWLMADGRGSNEPWTDWALKRKAKKVSTKKVNH